MNIPTTVSVIMLTYNHSAFLQDAIDSIINQTTTFRFELLIGEDYSNDGTRELVFEYERKFPEIIKVITSNSNVGSKANEYRVIKACKGKYLAFCEGDDYWNDPYKLQKQVDFLENNPDYGLVHGDVNLLNQKTGKQIRALNKTNNTEIPSGYIFEFLMKPSHSIKTMTTCFRRDLFEKYYLSNNEIMNSDWALIDISIWLMLAYHSKIQYFDEVFATYRLLPESASRTKNPERLYQFHQKIHDIREYFANCYSASEDVKHMLKIHRYKSELFDALKMGNKALEKESINKLISVGGRFSLKERFYFYVNKLKKMCK